MRVTAPPFLPRTGWHHVVRASHGEGGGVDRWPFISRKACSVITTSTGVCRPAPARRFTTTMPTFLALRALARRLEGKAIPAPPGSGAGSPWPGRRPRRTQRPQPDRCSPSGGRLESGRPPGARASSRRARRPRAHRPCCAMVWARLAIFSVSLSRSAFCSALTAVCVHLKLVELADHPRERPPGCPELLVGHRHERRLSLVFGRPGRPRSSRSPPSCLPEFLCLRARGRVGIAERWPISVGEAGWRPLLRRLQTVPADVSRARVLPDAVDGAETCRGPL